MRRVREAAAKSGLTGPWDRTGPSEAGCVPRGACRLPDAWQTGRPSSRALVARPPRGAADRRRGERGRVPSARRAAAAAGTRRRDRAGRGCRTERRRGVRRQPGAPRRGQAALRGRGRRSPPGREHSSLRRPSRRPGRARRARGGERRRRRAAGARRARDARADAPRRPVPCGRGAGARTLPGPPRPPCRGSAFLRGCTAGRWARAGAAQQITPLLQRLQELPTSDAKVRGPLAKLLGTVALASHARASPNAPADGPRGARPRRANPRGLPRARRVPVPGQRPRRRAGHLGERAPAEPGERRTGPSARTGQGRGATSGWALPAVLRALRRRLRLRRRRARRPGFPGRPRGGVPLAVSHYFEVFPEGPVPVVIYPDRSFDKEGHASWSAAVYDGKIGSPPRAPALSRSPFAERCSTSTRTRFFTAQPPGRASPPGSTRGWPRSPATVLTPGRRRAVSRTRTPFACAPSRADSRA